MKLFKNLFFLFFLITASSVYAQNCNFEISSSPHPADPMIMGFGHVGPDEPLNALWEFGDDSTANWTKGGQHTYAESGVYIVCLTVDACPKVCIKVHVGDAREDCDFEISNSASPADELSIGFGHNYVDALNVKWEFGDDSTANWIGGVHTYAKAGEYEVCVTIDDCPKVCKTISVGTLGVDQLKLADFSMYPNPAVTNVNVKFNLDEPQNLDFQIISSLGEVVKENTINGYMGANHSTIDLGELPKGIYTLRIVGVSGSLQKTILKL
jgi:hypothetical protein